MGSSLFEMMILGEGWCVGEGVGVVGRGKSGNALFSHETAFDLFDEFVSCHSKAFDERLSVRIWRVEWVKIE